MSDDIVEGKEPHDLKKQQQERALRQLKAWEALIENPNITEEEMSKILVDSGDKFPLGVSPIQGEMLIGLSGITGSTFFNTKTEEFLPDVAKRVCNTIASAAHIEITQNKSQSAKQIRGYAEGVLKDWATRTTKSEKAA